MLNHAAGPAVHSSRPRPPAILATYSVGVGCLVTFAVLTWQVLVGVALDRADRHWHEAVVGIRQPWLTVLARAVTACGSVVIISLVTVVCAVVFVRRDRAGSIVLAGSVIVASFLVLAVKNAVGRERPPVADILGVLPRSYSFPSGHTTMSTVLYGVLTLIAVRHLGSAVRRRVVAVSGELLVVGVGFSRVYLGFHWVTDVVAGWLLGGAIVAVALVLLRSRDADCEGAG